MRRSMHVVAAALILVLLAATPDRADDYPGSSPVRHKTLYNLTSRAYLSLDGATGKPVKSASSSQFESGTYWEVREVGRQRGYRAHLLIQRGNNKFNEAYLEVDSKTGELKSGTSVHSDRAKWLVRYAGRYNGYDSYLVQNLGRSEAGVDMQFLVIDPQTGAVRLDPKPVATAYWRVRRAPDLPSELVHSGTR